ncbi:hypothetical protein SDC9_41124 [bioreactor metagenome]|uniref:Uncharacterized protein n=1 Tax=bioreactor metagenome TaxID=1076179 RepID=A0A644VU85_9ZZZZ
MISDGCVQDILSTENIGFYCFIWIKFAERNMFQSCSMKHNIDTSKNGDHAFSIPDITDQDLDPVGFQFLLHIKKSGLIVVHEDQ